VIFILYAELQQSVLLIKKTRQQNNEKKQNLLLLFIAFVKTPGPVKFIISDVVSFIIL
jgi:hypothetical protein